MFFAHSQEIKSYPPCLKYVYQQNDFTAEDSLGDYLLAESMKALKNSIKRELVKNFTKKISHKNLS
jgi:hypothetical protein